jgi:hypothetical protein
MKPILSMLVCLAILFGVDAYLFDGRYFTTLQQLFWSAYYRANH